MATNFVFPPPSEDIGWFDAYAAGKVGRPDGSYDELVIAPAGSELSSADAQTLQIWLIFHQASLPTSPVSGGSQTGSSVGETVTSISGKVEESYQAMTAFFQGLVDLLQGAG